MRAKTFLTTILDVFHKYFVSKYIFECLQEFHFPLGHITMLVQDFSFHPYISVVIS